MRMTIYVPDYLKRRLDAAENLNKSAIAQAAFERAILNLNIQENPNMIDIVQRLQISKRDFEDEWHGQGIAAGKKWASEDAEYSQLLRLSNDYHGDDAYNAIRASIDPDDEMSDSDREDFWRNAMNLSPREKYEDPPDIFFEGFVDGAITVFNSVLHHLDEASN